MERLRAMFVVFDREVALSGCACSSRVLRHCSFHTLTCSSVCCQGNNRASREEIVELLSCVGSPPVDGSLWTFEDLADSLVASSPDGEVDPGMLLSANWEHRMRVVHWIEGMDKILQHRPYEPHPSPRVGLLC